MVTGFSGAISAEFEELKRAITDQDKGTIKTEITGKMDVSGLVKADVGGTIEVDKLKNLETTVNGLIEAYLRNAGIGNSTDRAQIKPPTPNIQGGNTGQP